MTFTNQSLLWLSKLLKERYGHKFLLTKIEANSIKMMLPGATEYILFNNLQQIFFQSDSNFPCESWNASTENFLGPISDSLFAPSSDKLPTPLVSYKGSNATCSYDILGLTYWMLTRLEEVDRKDLDEHDRFPATSSHAYHHGYLHRPIVDEWLDILGQIIKRVWPSISLQKHEFALKTSHDVDVPSLYGFKSWPKLLRTVAVDIVKRRRLNSLWLAPRVKLNSSEKLHPLDPANTFKWLLQVLEENELKSSFYFLSANTDKKRDADYVIEDPSICKLMQHIYERGHEIGLHPSYQTYLKPNMISDEFNRLKNLCHKLGIKQEVWGGRMHYLRWKTPTTLQAWEDANLTYDSTLGYADYAGFRCGTCFEYPAYNPITHEALKLRIRPLIAMECSVISPIYMNLGYSEKSLNQFLTLKNACRKVGGNFSLLWHNNHFMNKDDFNMFINIINKDS